MNSKQHKPNFLYIGPPKSGSTWLYEVLAQHPDVFVPVLKDIYFFDRYFDRGVPWYFKQFKECREQSAIGEISHDYLYSKDACARIAQTLPGVKLITILRDPTSRAISHFRYLSRFKKLPPQFEKAIKAEPEILECGLYAKYLLPYFETFPREAVGVFFFDDLKSNATEFASRIFSFLNVENDVPIDCDRKANSHAVSRSVLLGKLAKSAANISRQFGWTRILGRAKQSSVLRSMLFRSTGIEDERYDLSNASSICQEYYAEDCVELEELLQVRLPWVK